MSMKVSAAYKRFAYALVLTLGACSSSNKYMKTVDKVDINKFMGKWYVLAGRFTYFEKQVHNGVETYTWNAAKQRIDIDFTYNQGSLAGPVKSMGQKGWIANKKTNAHWQVSPLWPLKFDFLVLALAPDYSWTAIGVPSQKYLWIMARSTAAAAVVIKNAVAELRALGYDTGNLTLVPHG